MSLICGVPHIADVKRSYAGSHIGTIEVTYSGVVNFTDGLVAYASDRSDDGIPFHYVVVCDKTVAFRDVSVVGLDNIVVPGAEPRSRICHVFSVDVLRCETAIFECCNRTGSTSIGPLSDGPLSDRESNVSGGGLATDIGVSNVRFDGLATLQGFKAPVQCRNPCSLVYDQSVMGRQRSLLLRECLGSGGSSEIGIRVDELISLNAGGFHLLQLSKEGVRLLRENYALISSSGSSEEKSSDRQPFPPYFPLLSAILLLCICAIFIWIGIRERRGGRSAFLIMCGFPFFLAGAFIMSLLRNSSNAANFPYVCVAERPGLRPARA